MHARSPALSALKEMLEIAFFASMKTEEPEQVLCNLAYVNMNNPDPTIAARRRAAMSHGVETEMVACQLHDARPAKRLAQG
jgi:hypothetical protein